MTTVHYPLDTETLLIDTAKAREAAKPYADAYKAGTPYPHICIDDFLPEQVLRRVQEDMKQLPEGDTEFKSTTENLKAQYSPERLPAYTRQLLYALNSRHFIAFLEELTGIDGLIPDPYYVGGGIHRTKNGGHLDIHADFNLHKKVNLERRINVLIYLNDDWQEDWGGCFEIWTDDMSKQVAKFAPTFNRMVAFSTGSSTMHGNPEPVNHPNGEPRISIALYYYTATWDDTRVSHSTVFKPRPGSEDASDARARRRRLMQDILPPIVYRRVANPLRRIGF